MIEQNIEEWRNEAIARFGEKASEWKFICSACEHIQSVGDFREKDLDPQKSYTNCMGRFDPTIDCNWVSYGLLGSLDKGRIVITEDGEKSEIFDFAPISNLADNLDQQQILNQEFEEG
jgi:hypothetical protein